MNFDIFEKKNAVKILLFLKAKEMQRFKDLKKVVPREATLSVRLKELQLAGLVAAMAVQDEGRNYFAYHLTLKGNKIALCLNSIQRELTKKE